VWKGLLKLHALAIVKNFMWRVCHNLLPTKGNLFSRNIVPDPLCTMCLQEPKTFHYIMWKCPSSMGVWQACNQKLQKLATTKVDGAGLLQFFWTHLQDFSCWKHCLSPALFGCAGTIMYSGMSSVLHVRWRTMHAKK
jgi:hypothetical protein